MHYVEAWKRSVAGQRSDKSDPSRRAAANPTAKEEKIALVRKSAFDQPQYRPPLYSWRLRSMFVGQHSKGLPEFIQQDGRVDLCSCDTLTSIAGGYQCGSLRIVHR